MILFEDYDCKEMKAYWLDALRNKYGSYIKRLDIFPHYVNVSIYVDSTIYFALSDNYASYGSYVNRDELFYGDLRVYAFNGFPTGSAVGRTLPDLVNGGAQYGRLFNYPGSSPDRALEWKGILLDQVFTVGNFGDLVQIEFVGFKMLYK